MVRSDQRKTWKQTKIDLVIVYFNYKLVKFGLFFMFLGSFWSADRNGPIGGYKSQFPDQNELKNMKNRPKLT